MFNATRKFRGKDTRTGAWRFGYYSALEITSGSESAPVKEMIHRIKGPDVGDYLYTVDPATIGQCTDLVDKTGADIFEGDILKDDKGRIFVIDHMPGGSCLFNVEEYRNFQNGAPMVLYDALADIQTRSFVETVLTIEGNVYDNPELLQTKGKNTYTPSFSDCLNH